MRSLLGRQRHRFISAWLPIALACGVHGCSGPVPSLLEVLPTSVLLRGPAPRVLLGEPFVTSDGRTLHMDVVFPAELAGPAPAVVLVHGGFWLYGDRSYMNDWATDLADQGYVAASVDYRLLGEGGRFPVPVADVLAGLAHVRSRAADWNLDPDRVALFGDSAGSNLALLAGMASDASVFDSGWPAGESAGVRAIVEIYGPTDFLADLSTAQPWQVALVNGFLGGSRDTEPDVWAAASPVGYARADGPPVLIVHAVNDPIVPYTQAQSLNEALDAAGQEHQFISLPEAGHFWGSVWISPPAQSVRPGILEFLTTHLASAPAD